MIIVHAITRFDAGGAQKHLLLLMQQLSLYGIEQYVISGRGGKWFSQPGRIHGLKHIVNPFLIRRPDPFLDILALFYSIVLLRRIRRTGVTILHSNAPKAGFIMRWAGFLSGIKYNIFTIHGWHFHDFQNAVLRRLIVIAEYLTEKITCAYISVCEGNIDIAERAGLDIRKKTTVIYGGYEANHEVKVLSNDIVIGTVTNFKKWKNTGDFIKIARELNRNNRDLKYLIIGDGPGRNEIEKMVDEMNLRYCFEFTGYTDEPEKYISRCNFLVSTSLWEGMPRVLAEAYLCNVPFFAYDIGCNHEFAKMAGIEEHITKPDYKLLAQSIDRCISDRQAGFAMNPGLIKSISIEMFTHKHIKFYENLQNAKISYGLKH